MDRIYLKEKPCTCCNGTGKELRIKALAKALRRRRERAGVALSEIARRSGASKSYVSLIETGKQNPYKTPKGRAVVAAIEEL